jgi:ubiquinone/menaquinone biosynthesis C-methylase UbiE
MNSAHQPTTTATTPLATDFWDALAPYHSALEDNYLNRASIRRIAHQIHEPVLVVGAGQGLIVAELHKLGLQCDGVDFSTEMIRNAKIRRGLTLVHADARRMPFENGSYSTMIFATGVIDFMGDEEQIRLILNQGMRVVKPSGTIFVAFYRMSVALQQLLKRVGLLVNHDLLHRESLENYLLSPFQTVVWGARKAGVNRLRAAWLFTRAWALSTMQEKFVMLKMQRIFRRMDDPDSLIKAAPEKLPYRDETEIQNLFQRLAIPIDDLRQFSSCYIVKLLPP